MTQMYILEIVTQSAIYRTNPKWAMSLGDTRNAVRKVMLEGTSVHTRMNINDVFEEVETSNVVAKYIAPAAIHVVNIIQISDGSEEQ